MYRDYLRYEPEWDRGVSSKQLVAELRAQGVGPDEAIAAVSRQFGVSRTAAALFVLSHPDWADGGKQLPGSPGWGGSALNS